MDLGIDGFRVWGKCVPRTEGTSNSILRRTFFSTEDLDTQGSPCPSKPSSCTHILSGISDCSLVHPPHCCRASVCGELRPRDTPSSAAGNAWFHRADIPTRNPDPDLGDKALRRQPSSCQAPATEHQGRRGNICRAPRQPRSHTEPQFER